MGNKDEDVLTDTTLSEKRSKEQSLLIDNLNYGDILYMTMCMNNNLKDQVLHLQELILKNKKNINSELEFRKPNSELHITLLIPFEISIQSLLFINSDFVRAFLSHKFTPKFRIFDNSLILELCNPNPKLIDLRKRSVDNFYKKDTADNYSHIPLHITILKDINLSEDLLNWLLEYDFLNKSCDLYNNLTNISNYYFKLLKNN